MASRAQSKSDGARQETLALLVPSHNHVRYLPDLLTSMDRQSREPNEILNIGSGEETTIRELAERVAETVGFGGNLEWDVTKPDGTPRKALDSHRLFAMGWKPLVPLLEGLKRMYNWYLENIAA